MGSQTIENADVLFQKLGKTWYVFTEVEGEMIFSALPEGIDPHSTRFELFEVIEDHLKKVSKFEKKRQKSTDMAM